MCLDAHRLRWLPPPDIKYRQGPAVRTWHWPRLWKPSISCFSTRKLVPLSSCVIRASVPMLRCAGREHKRRSVEAWREEGVHPSTTLRAGRTEDRGQMTVGRSRTTLLSVRSFVANSSSSGCLRASVGITFASVSGREEPLAGSFTWGVNLLPMWPDQLCPDAAGPKVISAL